MQDIDFDELDRAVSSLIGATPAAKTDDASAPVENMVNINVDTTSTQTLPTDVPSVEVSSIIGSITAPALNPTPAPMSEPTVSVSASTMPAPSILVQNRPNLGRAMDFVRPGNTPVSTTTNPVPSRRSVVVSPISLTELPPSTNPVAKMNNSATDVPVPTLQTLTDTIISTPNTALNNIPIGGSIVDTTTTPNEVPDSPFLSDTKVDKRPLGAFSISVNQGNSAEAPAPTYAASITPVDDNPSGKLTEDEDISTDMPLPAELQNNLLEIESLDTAFAPTPAAVTTPVVPATPQPIITQPAAVNNSADTSIASIIAASKTTSSTDIQPIVVTAPSQPAVQPNVATSIPQQYPTSTNATDPKTSATFDTSIYNNGANIKPVKRNNAWIWILVIVLVLIGATAGVGIYLLAK